MKRFCFHGVVAKRFIVTKCATSATAGYGTGFFGALQLSGVHRPGFRIELDVESVSLVGWLAGWLIGWFPVYGLRFLEIR